MQIQVSVEEQVLRLIDDAGALLQTYPISTAAKGTGCEEGSFCTPLGSFVIREKIGHDAPPGTIFKGRKPAGRWEHPGKGGHEGEEDLILSRILWLDGVEPHNANTHDRYIYIHGTNQESLIGQPASHGCIRMKNTDVIDLFERTPEGTPLLIE